ncbi:MAG: aspartate--tRNA ligase, partial [Brevundimonas sp.]
MHAYRSHTCGALRSTDAGANVRLSGWVHRKRDLGGLLFVDLRDHYGMTQLVLHPSTPGFEIVERLRAESVIRIDGEAVMRDASTVNPLLPTGEVEVRVQGLEVLSEAAELPMPVFGDQEYPEEIRLANRFLDLRRERLHKNIVLRSKVISSIRQRMVGQGFLEYQTPILTASSPEGARDFLVPSRMHPGKFYALPQAPQQFKQLLMVSGFDRYFQIAPCFRDEDLRADRSLEFYQLDVEMSFVTQEDVFAAIEPVMHGVFEEFSNGLPVSPISGKQTFTNDFGETFEHAGFERLTYAQSMAWYGTDKPDTRNPIRMQVVSD